MECDTRLQLLSKTLLQLPAGIRSDVLLHCIGFVPASELDEFNVVGPIRALFAEIWENETGGPIPIRKLRHVLVTEADPGVVLQLGDVDAAETETELANMLSRLVEQLVRLARSNGETQLRLFEQGRTAPKRHSLVEDCEVGGFVDDLTVLVRSGKRFRTIYADPPWPYENRASRGAAANHYETMSVDQIYEEPVAELAADDAHLHLWTTNAFLREAFSVMDAWGFRAKSCLVWVKPQFGAGNYWRVSHEFLLLGVRGSLCFRDRRLRSWLVAPRTEHSRKPGIVRLLIEKASPGPYLELYGREWSPDSPWSNGSFCEACHKTKELSVTLQ